MLARCRAPCLRREREDEKEAERERLAKFIEEKREQKDGKTKKDPPIKYVPVQTACVGHLFQQSKKFGRTKLGLPPLRRNISHGCMYLHSCMRIPS